jgi:ribosomal protein S18 acetylase RimI-like enzyme
VGRAATPDDVPAVADCLTSAFFNDPLWGAWSFPDESVRARRLHRLMSFWATAGVRRPWVRMTAAAASVAVWVPPGEPEMTGDEEAAFEALIDRLFGSRSPEVMELFDRFDEHHPRQEPHYYLSLWATHRDHAGRGVGTALLRENLAQIDSQRMPAYLESTNPLNVPRYEALGFRRRGEFISPHGPTVTTMWRPAN